MEEKSCGNILIYDNVHKTLIGAKSSRIMFDKVDWFIRDYNWTKYLVLFGPKTYDAVFDRIRFLIGLKSGITYVDSHNHTEIKINSDDDLTLKKQWLCIMLSYLLSQFLIKTITIITIKRF